VDRWCCAASASHPHTLRRYLKHRLGELHGAFDTAIAEHKYQGGYCCVYPIKVNQQRQVVEEVLESASRSISAWKPAPRPS